jgi:hypothetical protein
VTEIPFLKEIKLSDHEDKQVLIFDWFDNREAVETTSLDEFVDRYYHNPEEYFHSDNSSRDTDTTGKNEDSLCCYNNHNNIAYENQIIQNHLKNIFSKNRFEISHLQNAEITSESQQNSANDIENTAENSGGSRKLSDDENRRRCFAYHTESRT